MSQSVSLGMKPFQDWIYQGHPEYAIFAVKAPIENVGAALVEKFEVKEWQKQVASEKSLFDALPENNSQWIPVLQPADNDWTVVYWYVGGWKDLSYIYQKLSSLFQTRTISLAEEDTSCAIAYDIYDNGEKLESAEWCPGEELMFESSIREEPELDNFEDYDDEEDGEEAAISQFFNGVFIEEGVFIPSWDMQVCDPSLDRVDLMKVS